MSYQFQVFISYSRGNKVAEWIREIFKPEFQSILRNTSTRFSVFLDQESIDEGSSVTWPRALANSLATSQILVPIISGAYFESDWCKIERELIVARERETKSDLIIPVIAHDGRDFLWQIFGDRNVVDVSDVFYRTYHKSTKEYTQFLERCDLLASRVVAAVQSCPDFNPEWSATCLKMIDAHRIRTNPRKQSMLRLGEDGSET